TTQGEYSLALEGGSGPQANATGDSAGQGQEVDPGVFYMGDLTLGTPAVGLISATSYAHLYTIQLQQGDDVMVAMLADASNLDPYLIFGLEDGTVLAEDDDSGAQGGGRYDAYVRLTAPQTGSYIVVATRAGLDTGQSAGDYRLIAAYAEETPATGDNSDLPAGVEALGAIATGAPMTGAISSTSYAHLYTLNGSAGETVTITMAGAGGLDAYLGLLDPENQVIAEDDDSGGGATGYDAQISIRLPESGSYVIVATRAGIDEGTSTGSYTLTVTSGAPPAPTGVTGTSGVGGFGGLPGRAFQAGDTTFYLRGFGATDNPDKATPLQGLLLPEQPLPGRSITTDGQKFYLTGFGATDDPAKATPLQAFLNQ
ncbi:MAG: PPC domain-containing protein, partial [Anaerolineae bacterium]|nr:PPC domain-containing protein [Anaerolineae bacterium]